MNSESGTGAVFTLDARLAAEMRATVALPLCDLILRDEAVFPWLVLVPRVPAVMEPFDLPAGQEAQLWQEVSAVGSALKRGTGCQKINIAAFGNMVPQLHIHVVARSAGDPAWPGSAIGTPLTRLSSDPEWWGRLVAALADLSGAAP